jgi:hypothetical protein
MKSFYTLLFFTALCASVQPFAVAQTGCPGCVIDLPEGMAEDTIYLSSAPTGQAGVYYEEDISFRMPKTTTPVAATDPDVIPGIAINKITINSVSNLPPGLSWQPSQTEFNPSNETDGCVRFCGTPLQPGLYMVEVVVTAQVFIVSQTTSFSFPMEILPSQSITEGFTMINNNGCGAVTVSFLNNVPSGGAPGFSYLWDFGNGTSSIDENPFDQTYSEPGVYPVSYRAIVDTSGFFLTNVRVDQVGCNDLFNGPDLYIEVYNPSGEKIYTSGVLDNASPPVEFIVNIPIEPGSYSIRVLDEDSGLGGADDVCGTVNFNQLSNGLLQDSDMSLVITVIHPVDTVYSEDTVVVFPQPAAPQITGIPSQNPCNGWDVALQSSYEYGNQWYQDSLPLPGGMEATLNATASGAYWVTHTSSDGCTATSEVAILEFEQLPEIPVFQNNDNLLAIVDESELPNAYSLQWLLDGDPIEGADGTELCIDGSGEFSLIVVDEVTGCENVFTQEVDYDPDFAGCLTATGDLFPQIEGEIHIFPNPTHGPFYIAFHLRQTENVMLQGFDSRGRLLKSERRNGLEGDVRLEQDWSDLPAGFYLLRIQIGDRQTLFQVIRN